MLFIVVQFVCSGLEMEICDLRNQNDKLKKDKMIRRAEVEPPSWC